MSDPEQPDWFNAITDAPATRAISLWQPWGQWVMLGWKPIETRKHDRFKGLVLQRIGIHAAAKWDPDWRDAAGPYLTSQQIFATERFRKQGGQILGTVFVRDAAWLTPDAAPKALIECASIRRFGLILSEPRRFETPIVAKGLQGIFKFTMPVTTNDTEQPAPPDNPNP